MILITSANYVNQELQSEFGRIPPSFLPLKNKRLFEHYNYNAFDTEVFISLPESYSLNDWDRESLKALGYQVIRVDESFSLGRSIDFAVNEIGKPKSGLTIIHGDTLFYEIPTPSDCFVVSDLSDNYDWGIEVESGLLYAGYFAIEHWGTFLEFLSSNNNNFIPAIEDYKYNFDTQIHVTDSWFDFGHLTTYYKSKSNFTTERDFNNLNISKGIVTKCGVNDKIKAEALWFQQIPARLGLYTPKFLGHISEGKDFNYKIEFKYLSSLNEVFVFGVLPINSWRVILRACFHVLSLMACEKTNQYQPLKSFVSSKTRERMTENFPFDPREKYKYKGLLPISINDIILVLNKNIPDSESLCEVMHGDFCLSNLLFDFRSQRIQMIDPRGSLDGSNFTINGFQSYDIAKLAHSVIGLYDFIVAERFKVIRDSDGFYELIIDCPEEIMKVQFEFFSIMEEKEINQKSIISICIHLFISMIPLHRDSARRQLGLYNNIFRLYKLLINYDSITNGRKR